MLEQYVLESWAGDLYMAATRKAAYGRLVDQSIFEQGSTEKQVTSQSGRDEDTYIYRGEGASYGN